MSNPVFSRNQNFGERPPVQSVADLEAIYNTPSSNTGSLMTYNNALKKIAIMFGLMLVTIPVGVLFPILALPAAIAGLVLVIVNAFKKKPSKGLTIAYALVEGVFVGGISIIFESMFPGVVGQAIMATLITVGVVLALFATGKIRATAKMTKIFFIGMISYLLFSLVNLGLQMFGVVEDPWGLRGASIPGTDIPFGLVIGLIAVLLASYSLVLDFDFIKRGVENRLPEAEGWNAALGVLVTVVWLYVEFLRIFGIMRD